MFHHSFKTPVRGDASLHRFLFQGAFLDDAALTAIHVDGSIEDGDWFRDFGDEEEAVTAAHRVGFAQTSKAEAPVLQAIKRVLANLALWVSEQGRGRRAPRGKRYTRRSRSMGQSVQVWDLGGEIDIRPELVDAARDLDSSAGRVWQARNRFAVRGHFRNQACGLARQSRKRIWIAPHWKGPELGARLARTYSAREGAPGDTRP